jgi:hypothetical protein
MRKVSFRNILLLCKALVHYRNYRYVDQVRASLYHLYNAMVYIYICIRSYFVCWSIFHSEPSLFLAAGKHIFVFHWLPDIEHIFFFFFFFFYRHSWYQSKCLRVIQLISIISLRTKVIARAP